MADNPADKWVPPPLSPRLRMEPDLATIAPEVSMASIAISLKRIADVLEGTPNRTSLVDHFGDLLHNIAHTLKT